MFQSGVSRWRSSVILQCTDDTTFDSYCNTSRPTTVSTVHIYVLCTISLSSIVMWLSLADVHQQCTSTYDLTSRTHLHVGYEPAGLTVHPPPRMIEGGFIFFAWVSSVTKFFSSRKKWILKAILIVKAYNTCFCVFLLKCNFYQLPIT